MRNKSQWIGLGIALGAAVGAAIGVALHQTGPWLAIGVGIGLAIGNALADRKAESACAAGARREPRDREEGSASWRY
jgi:hypothetical protein